MFSSHLLTVFLIVAVTNPNFVWGSTEEQSECTSSSARAQALMQQSAMVEPNSMEDSKDSNSLIAASSNLSMNEMHDDMDQMDDMDEMGEDEMGEDEGGQSELIQEFDVNEDGQVTIDEIITHLTEDGTDQDEVKEVNGKLQTLFPKADVDEDDALNDEELRQLILLIQEEDDDDQEETDQEETNSTSLLDYSGYSNLGNGKCIQSNTGNCDDVMVYNTNENKCSKVCDCYGGCVGFYHKSGSSVNPQGTCNLVVAGFVKGGGSTAGGAKCFRNNARTASRYTSSVTHYIQLGMCKGLGNFQLGSSYQGRMSRSSCESRCLSDNNCPGYSYSNAITRHCYKHSGPGKAYKQGSKTQGVKCHARGVNSGQGCSNTKVLEAKNCADN